MAAAGSLCAVAAAGVLGMSAVLGLNYLAWIPCRRRHALVVFLAVPRSRRTTRIFRLPDFGHHRRAMALMGGPDVAGVPHLEWFWIWCSCLLVLLLASRKQ